MRRWVKIGAAALGVAAAGLAVVWTVRDRNGAAEGVTVTGTIEALQVDVSARIAGRIVELTVRESQPVERGQLLVVLAAEEPAAEARRAAAAVRSAEAELRDLLAGARPQEIAEAEARAARAQAQLDDLLAGARREEVEQARAELRTAVATREWTERDFRRARELAAKELIAAQEVDRARQAYEVAAAGETRARERLALVEAGARRDEVQAARSELQAARERVALLRAGPRPETVQAARARVAEARAALALAEARLGEMRIASPITGVVLRKNLERGELASPGQPILTLMDPGDLWLRAYVPEEEAGRLRVGQPARVTVDAYPGRAFEGVVSEIASEAEFTPKNVQTRKERVHLVFRVKIAVRNVDGVLKPGLPADAVLAAR